MYMISIEVEGERIQFDDFYEDSEFSLGALYGMDEKTLINDSVRSFEPTKAVWGLAAFRKKEDGSTFGIQGLFRHGEWSKDEKGGLLYRVWDRII